MSMLINGKETSKKIKEELKNQVTDMIEAGMEAPTLAVVLVGDDPASQVYVNHKKKGCAFVGIRSLAYEMPETTSEEELLELIDELNERQDVHGILVQLPLPRHIDEEKVLLAIDPLKDVDGFHPFNVGSLSIGRECFKSCTPAGIIELLKRYELDIEGKNCVIVGRSNIVGKPISMMLLAENGTITICHSRTKDLKGVCKKADILIAAIGRAKMINRDYVKEGAVVIDVGINRLDNGKLCGDVDFDDVKDIAEAITPVPGGVGPMTIAMLLKNCVISAKKHQE
ncbi:bifunctional methylenetetrahydrofolate dehydrogenase/methenyltetrahydrofolate cyclohydrolase FolD [Vallitalea okinawensis]|uniref:bifunctional methylenetetrahydrofolate dehydrogenase/methenyltetrahydrofolate cyclohydrolase FolD n=1 Tax=Vallitalea okinawensis TaxID=2078660 RepID=UPI000CFB912B|nr:bifunctional methylenetetrahydrofolate dehydrogenase/methenyltetrahydrofolate cyclohydrolase FolD [Vallitalea okinawensis]